MDGESEETAVPISQQRVPEDPEDPDLLVLGFQELDLSTEALLYSTKTVREDAWCTAVFAGLGEKAVLYEKVRSTLVRCRVAVLFRPSTLLTHLSAAPLSSRRSSSSGCCW